MNKQNVIYNLRPGSFFGRGKFRNFESKIDFIDAVYETLKIHPSPPLNLNPDKWKKMYCLT